MSKVSDDKPETLGNLAFLNTIHKNPMGVEQLVNSYFEGFTRQDGKEIAAAGRKEIFYFDLGVPEEHLKTVYSEKAPALQRGSKDEKGKPNNDKTVYYSDVPKYYLDSKGKLKDYKNAQELKDIAKEITSILKEISRFAPNNYSAASQEALNKIYTSEEIRNFENVSAPEKIDEVVNVTQKEMVKNKDQETFLSIEPIKSYQEILTTANAALQKYKELANRLQKEPTVAFSSDMSISTAKPTPKELSDAFLRAIIDQKVITGLDPANVNFKEELAKISPESLKPIELSFQNIGSMQTVTCQIDATKYLDALKQIDPKQLSDKKYTDLSMSERKDTKEKIIESLTAANLFTQDGLMVEKFASKAISPVTRLKETPIKSNRIRRFSNIVKNRLRSKSSESNQLKNVQGLSEEKTNALNAAKEQQKSQFVDKKKIVFASEAKEMLSKSEKTKNLDKQMPVEAVSKVNISYQQIGETKSFTFPKAPQTATPKIPEEVKDRLPLRRTERSSDLTKNMPKNTPEPTIEKQKVEGPRTEKGHKPLPPTPVKKTPALDHNRKNRFQSQNDSLLEELKQELDNKKAERNTASSTPAKKVPPPIPPKSALATKLAQDRKLQAAQETLKKDGMTLKPGEKITKPSANNIKIGMHRTTHQKKNDPPSH